MQIHFKYLLFVASTLLGLSAYATEIEGDSTQSTIEFNQLEATVSARIIHFRWSVNSEERGDHFVIEKSIDQENWAAVTKVASIKSHEEQHTYEISEINFAEGAHEFFRVIRVDAFGDTTELDRVNINRPVLTNMLLIPVPRRVNKEVTISYDSMICSKGRLTVVNKKGEVYKAYDVNISEGYNRFQLEIKSLPKGEYRVFVKDEFDNKLAKRLVVYK